MPISTAIRSLHWAVTIILALTVAVMGYVWCLDSRPPDDELISKRQLSQDVWLYVTRYKNSSATDSNVYRYYLNRHIEHPMSIIQQSAPVLTADVGDAAVKAIDDHVMISVTGKVFNYSSSAFYYDGSTVVMPRIDLNATASNPWK